MGKEDWPVSCPMYRKDLELLRDFKERKGLKTLAEAAKVAVEYCNAHGVFK